MSLWLSNKLSLGDLLIGKFTIEGLWPLPCTIKNLLLPTDIKLALEIFEIEIDSSRWRNSLLESLISVGSNKFLIVHGRGQSTSIIDLPINKLPKENLLQSHEDITTW